MGTRHTSGVDAVLSQDILLSALVMEKGCGTLLWVGLTGEGRSTLILGRAAKSAAAEISTDALRRIIPLKLSASDLLAFFAASERTLSWVGTTAALSARIMAAEC